MRMIPLFRRSTDAATPEFSDAMQAGVVGGLGQLLTSPIDALSGLPASVYQLDLGTVDLTPGDAGLATVSVTYGFQPGVTNAIRGASVAELSAAFTPAQVNGVVTAANLRLDDGVNLVSGRTATDAADSQATLGNVLLAAIARLQGFDGATWDRLRTASADNVGALSSLGAQLAAAPGNWSVTDAPLPLAQATVTRAAAAGQRHVCTSITASLTDSSANGDDPLVLLRDGATGVGTILWQTRLSALFDPAAAGGNYIDRVALSGLNIVGSVNTAMTLEFVAASAADMQQTVALTGFTTG